MSFVLQTHSKLRRPSTSLELCLLTHVFIWFGCVHLGGFPDDPVVRLCLPMQVTQEMRVQSLSWEDPLKEKMATTLIFLPGKHHAERSLAGYNPWDHQEWDMTDHTHTDTHTSISLLEVKSCPSLLVLWTKSFHYLKDSYANILSWP